MGGIKEKVLAASRAGLTTVILPKRNEGDLEDLPEAVREKINFVFAEEVDDVVRAALVPEAESLPVEPIVDEPMEAESPGAEPVLEATI